MRCDEVIRQLNEPAGERDEPGLTQHLADCASCARRAEQAARLERLWEAASPPEPAPEAWERVWASVSSSLDAVRRPGMVVVAGDDPDGRSARMRRWRGLAAVGLVALAQAAAVVVAVGLSWNGPVHPVDLPKPPMTTDIARLTAPSLDSVVEVEEGQNVLIRSEGVNVQIVDLSAPDSYPGEDPWYIFFNRVESASPAIAMTE